MVLLTSLHVVREEEGQETFHHGCRRNFKEHVIEVIRVIVQLGVKIKKIG